MTISNEMEQVLLEYFAQDDGENREFQSLTTIFERVIRPSGWRDSHFSDVSGIDDKSSLKTILDQMVIDGLLQKDWAEGGYDPTYRATDDGLYEATIGWDALVVEREIETTPTYDSTAWTGLTAVRINAKNALVVSSLIAQALDKLPASTKGNEAIMQAAAYLKAAKELVDAPNPPSVVIWDLIQKAAAIAGLLQLYGMIFSQVCK